MLSAVGCKKMSEDENTEDFTGELVVIQDRSDIVLGAYNIDTLNPFTTKSKSSQRILNIVYESLFTFGEELNIEPILAENYYLSEDGSSITVNLKTDVKWQDGTNFNSEDVVYSISKLVNSDGIYSKVAGKIKSYTATGEHSVQIDFYTPGPDFAYLLTFPIISRNTYPSDDNAFMPMGTGSYKLVSRSSSELFFEPNTLWHGGQASDKKLVVKILKDENTATNALNVKEIDAVALETYNQDTSVPNLNSVQKAVSSNNMVFLGFNTASPVMTQNLRRAICSIIDKKALVEKNAYGKGMACTLSVNPASWSAKLPETEKEDVDGFMTSDGYSLYTGMYYKEGSPLTVRLLVNSDNLHRLDIANGIVEMLKVSGVEVVLDVVSYEEYLNKINYDDFDMFIGETDVLSDNNPNVMLDSNENYFNFDVSYLSEAVTGFYGISEKDYVKAAMENYRTKFYLNPPYLPLYFKSDVIIYGPYVSGLEEPTLFDTFRNIEKWYFYDKNGEEQQSDENNEE